MTDRTSIVKALPILLGPKNSEAATGFPWRWVRDTSAALGVPFVGAGHKRAVRADLFVAALERNNITPESEQQAPVDCGDPAAAVRAMIGKRKAGAL